MKEGWEAEKLVDICKIQYGYPFDSKQFCDDSKYPQLIRIRDVSRGYSETYYSGEIPEGYYIDKGDYLIGMDGEFNIAAWKSERALLNQRVCKISANDKVFDRFLYYNLRIILKQIEDETPFVTVKHLSAKKLNTVTINLPSLSEQQHIVEELDLLSSIIEKKKAQLKELDNLAQSLFYEMFGDNADCSTKKIKDIAIVKIGPFGSSLHKSDYVSGGTPLINPIHMSEGKILPDENFTITNEKKKELETYLLQTNDIIFGRRGDIGRCALVTRKENGYLCGTGSLFVRFQVNINPIYCINYLSTRFVKDYLVQNAKGATMLNLNSKIIENVPMLFPSLDLQNQFASKIEAIEHQKELIKQSIKEVETLLNSRMDYYFN